ncbi:MAG: hypothetical protein M1819_002221 [Sarea resinae]|nr:MAG: hypothetical protein M1819_002221 [Sarea resinae]
MATTAKPSKAAPPGSNPPNQTLYCTNLPDKLQKYDLRLSLYTLFSTYGPVLDVVALKTMKMRGQAHIVFRDAQASTQAMRALQGFDFFGKEMKIQYAKGKSDTIAKLDGTYRMPEPATAAGAVTSTQLQQSIFNAPPTSTDAQKPPATAPNGVSGAEAGTKRRRDDESDDEDAPMEEDDDEGDAPMEEASDED